MLSLDGVSAIEAETLLLDMVRTHLADLLRDISGAGPGFLDPRRSFRELGLDSLGAIELHRRLTLSTGLSLPVTVVFEYPSPAALARHLVALIRGPEAASAEAAAAAASPPAVTVGEPLAIVGMSCRYPGGIASPGGPVAGGPRRTGRDRCTSPATGAGTWSPCTTRIPDRHGKSYANRGGFLTRPPASTRRSSASHRVRPSRWILSSGCCSRRRGRSWSGPALTRPACAGTRTGVFVGAEPQEYGPRLHGGAGGARRATC